MLRKFILYLACLLIPWMARGQAAYEGYYWFDGETELQSLGSFQGHAHSFDAEAGHLNQGFHTLHVQVVDTAGVYSPVLTLPFFHVKDKNVVAVRYWFDNDTEHTVRLDYAGDNLLLDVSALEPGLHNLYLQIEDADGVLSDVEHRGFYRQMHRNALTWTYWFDDDESQMTTLPYPGESVMVDISELSEGFHMMHNIVNDITQSPVETRMFVKVPQTEGIGYMNCICSVDGKLVAQEQLPTRGGLLEWTLDVDSLGVGIHKAMFQAITPSGAASSIAERYFVREVTNRELGTMKCLYAIDGHQTYVQAGTMSNGLFHFDLNVDSLEDGLHRIAYMLVSDNGIVTPQKTAFFWKTPLGGSGITQYEYWLNRSENKHVIKLDKRTNPFSLISLLPVEAEPIRSECFHFEVKQGVPMMYAKNDFHIAFYDVTGRRVDKSEQYVDYTVQQVVDDIAELQTSQTFDRPAQNDIKWFSLQAEKGDTIAFRSSQATSLQVFSPTGQEVYAAFADKSVKFGGCHTWEDGTYYVAVHDVTGTRQNVTLDYMHMDRYDVVAQDVYTVGNGGASTITYQGNGFNDLYAVELYNAQGDTIHSVCIDNKNEASTSVTFDFSHAELGLYHALFRFTLEEKNYTNNVVVEDAKNIELTTQVLYPSTFLRGTTTSYTVKITNNGNMTAYSVPVYAWINAKTPNNVKYISIEGIDLPSLFSMIDTEGMSDEDIAEVRNISNEWKDTHYFNKIWGTSSETSHDSTLIMTNYFFVNIAPQETKTIKFNILVQDESIQAFFTVPNDWLTLSATNEISAVSKSVEVRKSNLAASYCCIKERTECILNYAVSALDVTSLVTGSISIFNPELVPVATGIAWADCAASAANSTIQAIGDLACNSDDSSTLMEKLIQQAKATVKSSSAIGTTLSCISAKLSAIADNTTKLGKIISSVASGLSVDVVGLDIQGFDCWKSFTTPKPNCPPNPGGGGGSSTPVNSYDPNDIYGYTAESGSRFMSDKVQQVNYRIEFENDTTFATASAHVVEIKDTLNAKQFDLNSYAPTGIKIGDRTEMLDGKPQFVRTIDMRPQINALAQVEGFYDKLKGIITYRFTSVDPMTMEPTDDVMQGFLPVNVDGTSGIGEVSYNVNLLKAFDDGTQISNRASIVFDTNAAILTPVWTNTIDAVCPEGRVTEAVLANDSTATIRCEGSDARSGVWKYEVYVQYSSGELWEKAGECPADSAEISFRVYDGMDYGFCALAVDSAGNVEVKEMAREAALGTYLNGDANADGTVDIEDVVNAMRYFLGKTDVIYLKAADITGDGQIDIEDVVGIGRIFLTQPSTAAKSPIKRQRLRESLQL